MHPSRFEIRPFFLAVSVGAFKFLKTRHYAMIGLFLKQNTLNAVFESPTSDDRLECQLSCTRQVCLWEALGGQRQKCSIKGFSTLLGRTS